MTAPALTIAWLLLVAETVPDPCGNAAIPYAPTDRRKSITLSVRAPMRTSPKLAVSVVF